MLNAGDTVIADFAFVPPLYLSTGTVKNDLVSVLLRVFVPTVVQAGVNFLVEIAAVQNIAATPATSTATAADAVLVAGSAVGRLDLIKAADVTGTGDAPAQTVPTRTDYSAGRRADRRP